MNKTVYEMDEPIPSTDEFGRRLDCHFYLNNGKTVMCNALKDFYSAENIYDQCRGCVFFKTDEEFSLGMKRRRAI